MQRFINDYDIVAKAEAHFFVNLCSMNTKVYL